MEIMSSREYCITFDRHYKQTLEQTLKEEELHARWLFYYLFSTWLVLRLSLAASCSLIIITHNLISLCGKMLLTRLPSPK